MSSPYRPEIQTSLEPDTASNNYLVQSGVSSSYNTIPSKGLISKGIMSASQQKLLGGLSDAIDPGKYQDLTIECQGRQWKVHRLIVCMGSKFFEKACENNFKEGVLGHINLEDDDPELVEKMILYLYKCDYPNGAGGDRPLVLHAKMYALGDKYDIEHLKNLSRDYFSGFLDGHALDDDFVNAVATIYNTTLPSDRGLRDCVAPKMKEHWGELRADDKFMDIVKSNNDIAIDLLDLYTTCNKASASKMDSERTPFYGPSLVCPSCGNKENSESSRHKGIWSSNLSFQPLMNEACRC